MTDGKVQQYSAGLHTSQGAQCYQNYVWQHGHNCMKPSLRHK